MTQDTEVKTNQKVNKKPNPNDRVPYCQHLTKHESDQLRKWHFAMNASITELRDKNMAPAPSGQRARLCRADTLPTLMMTDGYRALWFAINPEVDENAPEADQETDKTKPESSAYVKKHFAPLAWACIAGVIADVRNDITPPFGSDKKEDKAMRSIASMAGTPVENSSRSHLSELRFQQLQTADTDEEFLMLMRRLVKRLKRNAPIARLADDILCWFAEYHDRIPREVEKRIALKWASEYYAAASAKPSK